MAQALRRGIGSLLLRSHRATIAQQPAVASRRTFSANSAQHEDLEEAVKWRNITAVGYVVCTALTVYNLVGGHEEAEEKKEYSYLHIRNKEFPWGPDGLFEYHHEHEE